jgi:hypothetical protein
MTGYSFTTPVWDGGAWVTPEVAEVKGTPAAEVRTARHVNGPEGVPGWDAINWQVHEGNVRRLRQRIFKAAREQDWAKVRHQARNTDRRARGNTARPSGHDPSAELRSGFAFQEEPASRAARPHCPHPARRHKPRPGRGRGPVRPDPHRPRIFTQRDHPQMKWLRWSLPSLSVVEGWHAPAGRPDP